jgi:receptor protein-tyrosine kinase
MEFDLRAYARTLYKRRWYAIVVLALMLSLGALATARATKMYQTNTTLLVGQQQVAIEEATEGLFIRNFSSSLLKTYVEIIKSRSIAQQAIADSGIRRSPDVVQEGVDATAVVDTLVIEIRYRDADPGMTSRIANAVADAFVGRIDQLESAGTPAVQVSVVDRAEVPDDPVSPNPFRNMTLAFIVGLLGAVGIAFLVEQLDVTVKSRDEIESQGLLALGSIPQLDFQGEPLHLERDMQGPGGEAFRKLRTSLGFIHLESPLRSILVTSPVPQEGKTTTALNLAAAYAVGGLKTVLVEADLRRPSLHRIFGMYGTRGLTTAIVGDVPLSEAILHTDMRNLSVLLAGAIPPNPVELLSSDQMTDVLERLERQFDVVIVDSPPLAPVADPAALAARCDGVVIVARAGKTDRRRLVEAAQVTQRSGGRLLGVVLNAVKVDGSPDSYDYYYGYQSDHARAAAGKEQR